MSSIAPLFRILAKPDAAVLAALKVIKVLGRSPIGTTPLTTVEALDCLSSVMERKSFRESNTSTPSLTSRLQSHRPSYISSSDPLCQSEAQLEVLTTIANTLLLHDEARSNVVETRAPILAFQALKVSCFFPSSPFSNPLNQAQQNTSDIHFVAARCLFLCTLKPHPIVYKLVHEENLVDVIHAVRKVFAHHIVTTDAISTSVYCNIPHIFFLHKNQLAYRYGQKN